MAPALSISNRLLAALAPEDLDPLRPHLEPVQLPHKRILSNPNTPIDHVYFPQEGMVSLVQPLENGAVIEVGMIGNEGLVGVPVLLGADTSPLEAMVQIPGSALRLQASLFREEAGRVPPS
jgi:CRP-like cAMP-binding protein